MDFIKKHWIKILIGIIVLVIMILAILAVKELVFPDDKKSLYGNRLDGIEELAITPKRFTDLESKIKQNNSVTKVTHNINGRIINLMIDVKADTDLITAKAFGDEIMKAFSTEELAYYDLQLFLTCHEEENSELYPTIGYKHKASLIFKWNEN